MMADRFCFGLARKMATFLFCFVQQSVCVCVYIRVVFRIARIAATVRNKLLGEMQESHSMEKDDVKKRVKKQM